MKATLRTLVGCRVLLQLRGGQHMRGEISSVNDECDTVVFEQENVSPSLVYVRIEAVDAVGTS
jgi:small nuclear ribonucleoprotein (snRNP)-like protein